MSSLSFLHGIDTLEVMDGARPIRTLKSSVIGIVGTAGKGPINQPVLITNNPRDAASIFGAYTSDAFTIPKALNAIFKQGGATIVIVNVCDPEEHVSEDTVTEAITLRTNSAQTTRGFVSSVGIATAIAAPYTVSSMGTPRAYTGVVTASGKTSFTVASGVGSTYVVGENVTVVTSTVSGYLAQVAAVLSVTSTTVVLDLAYSANATGTISAPSVDRVTLPAGATLVDVRHLTTDAIITLPNLTLGQRVKVNYTATTVADTDYTVVAETGTIARIVSGSKILPGATLTVTYNYVDPSLVTSADVLGTVSGDGTLSGIEMLSGAMAVTGVRPRLLGAPGFTNSKVDVVTRNAVAVSLAAMAARLRAIVVASTVNASKEEAVMYKDDFEDPRMFLVYPSVNFPKPGVSGQVDEVTLDALTLGLIAATDNDPSGGFWHSPSNRLLNGPVSLSKPIDWGLSDTESMANYLNEHNVTVAIREGGFRLWGNRMSDGTFITTRRTADIIEDSIAEAHRYAVDRNITKGYVAQLLANVNSYLAVLERQGAILGGRAWFDPTLNTPTVVASGQLFIDYEFTPPVPAERITFRAHLVNDYITKIFD